MAREMIRPFNGEGDLVAWLKKSEVDSQTSEDPWSCKLSSPFSRGWRIFLLFRDEWELTTGQRNDRLEVKEGIYRMTLWCLWKTQKGQMNWKIRGCICQQYQEVGRIHGKMSNSKTTFMTGFSDALQQLPHIGKNGDYWAYTDCEDVGKKIKSKSWNSRSGHT